MNEAVNHPAHYGGAKNSYEAIKVIEAWGLNFNLGNTVKYIARAGRKAELIEDLRKARWYLDREISILQGVVPAKRETKKEVRPQALSQLKNNHRRAK